MVFAINSEIIVALFEVSRCMPDRFLLKVNKNLDRLWYYRMLDRRSEAPIAKIEQAEVDNIDERLIASRLMSKTRSENELSDEVDHGRIARPGVKHCRATLHVKMFDFSDIAEKNIHIKRLAKGVRSRGIRIPIEHRIDRNMYSRVGAHIL